MSIRTQILLGMAIPTLLAVAGVALLVAARIVGGTTLAAALLGGPGLTLYIAATVAGVLLAAGDSRPPALARSV